MHNVWVQYLIKNKEQIDFLMDIKSMTTDSIGSGLSQYLMQTPTDTCKNGTWTCNTGTNFTLSRERTDKQIIESAIRSYPKFFQWNTNLTITFLYHS